MKGCLASVFAILGSARRPARHSRGDSQAFVKSLLPISPEDRASSHEPVCWPQAGRLKQPGAVRAAAQ